MSHQLRRSFGTIHLGHLAEGVVLAEYFASLFDVLLEDPDFTAGAFALEEGTETRRRHIQFYMEHTRKRRSTLARILGVSTRYVFDTVRDAPGAWAYCTGTGPHRDKPAIDRWQFGTPKLHGDTMRADLKMLVNLAMDGITPEEMLRAYPYAWAVHRARMLAFYRDWENLQRYGQIVEDDA